MRTFEASSVVSASLLGGLLAPTNRAFPGGIGGCISQVLAALGEPATLALKKNSATSWDLSLVAPADRVALANACTNFVSAGSGYESYGILPEGGTKRHNWSVGDNVGASQLTGPLAAGIYSLEDFLNTLLDGGFDTELAAMNIALESDGISYIIIDQPNAAIYLGEDGAGPAAAYDAAVDAADATLTSTLSAWE